jgi:aurora kinase
MHAKLAALGTQQSRVTKPHTNPRSPAIKTKHLELAISTQALSPDPIATKSTPPESTQSPQPPSLSSSPLTAHAFELGARLGRGKFGRVYLARHIETNYICALKVLSKATCIAAREESLIRRELEVHRNLAHPHILRLLSWFHDTTSVYLVLEYAPGGSLFSLLSRQPDNRFREPVAARYVAQVSSALAYLHAKHVLHRDPKPENVLLGLDGQIKLADFGYSVRSSSGARTTICGTLDYLSPEVARLLLHQLQVQPQQQQQSATAPADTPTDADAEDVERYTSAVDRWSLGILAYELLVGAPPFERESADETRACIAAFEGRVAFPAHVSAGARDLIRGLLRVQAERRMGFEDVMAHPWVVGCGGGRQ